MFLLKDLQQARNYQAGKNNLANGIASLNTVKYPVTRIPLFLGGASAILVGPIIAVLGSYDPSGSVSASSQSFAIATAGYCIVVGGAIIFRSFSSNKIFMKSADKQLQKVADKLNEAINQQGIEKLQKVIGT